MYALTPSDIYQATKGGLDVILRYYPQAEVATRHKRAQFKIREEKTPSCTLSEHDGVWYVKDFGSSDRSMNAIDIVMKEERVDFPRALQLIAEKFEIQTETKKYAPAKARYERRPATQEEAEGSCTWVTKDWETVEFKAVFAQNVWRHLCKQGADKTKKEEPNDQTGYKAAKKICTTYNLSSLQSYSIVSKDKADPNKLIHHTFFSTEQYPILMFDEGDWQKFYKPKEREKQYRFFSTGRKPENYLFGEFQLNKAFATLQDDTDDENENRKEKKLPEVVICTGGSDALNVAAIGYAVVWQNSETAVLSSWQFSKLTSRAERVYNLPDIDDTGQKEAMRLALEYLELHTIYLPDSLREKRDLRGNPCKDVRDYFRFYDARDFRNLLTLSYPLKFWDEEIKRNKEGNVIVKYGRVFYEYKPNNELIYNFLYRQGFGIMEMPTEKAGESLIHVDGHIVKKIEFRVVNRYVKEFLKQKFLGVDLINAFHRSPHFSESSLKNLNYIELPFEDTSRHDQYMFFQNVIWRITKEGIEESDPKDCNRYVWHEEVIPHDVQKQPESFRIFRHPETGKWDIRIYNKDCLFLKFLINTSRVHWRKELQELLDEKPAEYRREYLEVYKFAIDGQLLDQHEIQEQKQHLISKLISYGYYLHRYKDPANPLCVWAMDYAVENTDESNGGTGKSIFFKSLTYLMKHHFLNGRDKRLSENKHMLEGVDQHTDLLWVDDMDKYNDFAIFYPIITGPTTVNPKGTAGYTIDFEDSPKVAVTSNYPPAQNDKTTRRRLWFTAFSDYYHKNPNGEYREERLPIGEFGKTLFNEFTEEEWNSFLNTAALCCQSWMVHGQVEPPMETLMSNVYRNIMGETFHGWADTYFSKENDRLNSMVPKRQAYETYKREYQGQISAQGFLGKLKSWCNYHAYTLNPPEAITTKDGRMMKWTEKMVFTQGEWKPTDKKESVECIYIQTDRDLPINDNLPQPSDLPF